ncbi:MAG: hypothetical protein V4640_11690 [Verrucomicrobiota bacterium]
MKLHVPIVAFSLVASLAAAEAPKIFSGLFKQDVPVKGQIGVVLPPPEIDKYVGKVEKAARADSKWFKEFSAAAKPGEPLPYDERLGLTKAEYDDYIELWGKRAFKSMVEVMLLLRKGSGDTWSITSTGEASTISTLRYSAEDDTFSSPNGVLKRIDDIKADSSSILGAWTGMEWRFEEETGLGKTKENLALGRFTDSNFGLIVYRAQETSTEGTRLLDKSLVIRFPIAASATAAKPAAKPVAAKPAKKK